MSEKKERSNWGWGYADVKPSPAALRRVKAALFPADKDAALSEPDWNAIASQLRKPRFQILRSSENERIIEICSDDPMERIRHSYGKAFRDVVRALEGKFDNPPDYIAFPRNEGDIVELIRYCQREHIAVIPYGGGSSVVGGIEPPSQHLADQLHWPRGVITVDMKNFDKIIEVDHQSLSARVQGGVYGPDLLNQLKKHGLTLRHFPQSFEFSTVGGWVATRAGGHYASGRTHIDDFVMSCLVVTPKGVIQTRRLPASGAGPQPERVVAIGSEGIFGIVTECVLNVQKPVKYRVSETVTFDDFLQGSEAVRSIIQSGSLQPANCRLIDPIESFANGLSPSLQTTLILGFEASEFPDSLDSMMKTAVKIAVAHGGTHQAPPKAEADETLSTSAAADAWKDSFLRAPYLRDELVKMGYISETFETACPWDKFPLLYQSVSDAVREAAPYPERCIVTCRFTHVYPSGPAPYFTVIAAAKAGKHPDRVKQWDLMKSAASEAILHCGGTATHHHAVGRDHGEFYRREADSIFLSSLAALKHHLDPEGIMNPGILIHPQPSGHGKLASLSKL